MTRRKSKVPRKSTTGGHKSPPPVYTILDMERLTGVPVRTLRFYSSPGRELLQSATGHGPGRHYTQEHVERVKRIRELQAQGHPLTTIKDILDGRISTVGELLPLNKKPLRFVIDEFQEYVTSRNLPGTPFLDIDLGGHIRLQTPDVRYTQEEQTAILDRARNALAQLSKENS